MLNGRMGWVLFLSLLFAALFACSKKEEAPVETKAVPQVGVEHAKEQAHQGVEEAHRTMEAMHGEMKEGHQAMTEIHERVVAAADLALGEKIYNENCAACHDRGIAGAPKLGDRAAWETHLAEGIEHLQQMALSGEGAMPPRGGNPALSDEDVRAAVGYMVEKVR